MRKIIPVFSVLCLFALPAHAAVEGGYDPERPRAVTPWYGRADAAARAADLGFIGGMRPHHAGALTMSEEYLRDKKSGSGLLKQLARGIIRNQEFEISMLDTVRTHLEKAGGDYERVATGGLAQRQKFLRAPMPGFFDRLAGSPEVTARDVQFAKAMIVHHEGALDMAYAYLGNPSARNGYLRLMCLDILTDQKQEIAFMEKIIAAYPGDADAVKIDASMVHGMEGMNHAAPKPAKKAAEDPHAHHH